MPEAEWSTTIQEEDAAEEEELPLWVQSIYEKWHSLKSTVMNAWRRRGAVRQFLKAVKEVRANSMHHVCGTGMHAMQS